LIINSTPHKLIAVTSRIDFVEERHEYRDSLDQRVHSWLFDAGFLPVAVPNTLPTASQSNIPTLKKWLQLINPSAVILSGGNDIGGYPERDNTERYILTWAQKRKMPVLGICRGMQMLGMWAGAELIECKGHVGKRHQLIHSGIGIEGQRTVNSYHNYALSFCPNGFEITAQAEDGTIEAIKHKKMPWEGWMWHPERELPFSLDDTKRLTRLFSAK